MLAPNTLLQNRYLIMRSIGQGGMGAVYLAKDQRLGNTVALKETFFNEERMRRAFEREARLLAHLRHPALPKVIDHFNEGDGQFLVMEFISGDDLELSLAQRGRPFPPTRVLFWADELLKALDYLHRQEPPILHRDIKPANLKLTTQGEIILLDFGLAKGSTGHTSSVATSRSVFGFTPNFAPLEQIQGTGTGPRSDLYSLAATLYYLMTGVIPPDALTRITEVANGQPDPLRPASEINAEIPPAVDVVLMSALAQNREQRPASAAAMREALRDATQPVASESIHHAKTIIIPPAESPRQPTPAAPPAADPTAPLQAATSPASAPVPSPDPAPPALAVGLESSSYTPPAHKANRLPWIISGVAVFVAVIMLVVYLTSKAGSTDPTKTDAGTKETTTAAAGLIVSKSGDGQYKTIAEALRNAQPGTRITVRPGVYDESLTIDKKVEIIGDGPAGQVIIESTNASAITMRADSALVRGLSLRTRRATRTVATADTSEWHYATASFQTGRSYEQEDPYPKRSATPYPTPYRDRSPKQVKRDVNIGVKQPPTARPRQSPTFSSKSNQPQTSATPAPTPAAPAASPETSAGALATVNILGGQLVLEDCDIASEGEYAIRIDNSNADPIIRRCKIHGASERGIVIFGKGTIEDCDIYTNHKGVEIGAGGSPLIRRCRINRNETFGVYVVKGAAGSVEDCDLTGNGSGAWGNDGAGNPVRQSRNKV